MVDKRLKFLLIIIAFLWQSSITFAQLLDVPLGDELYREVYDFMDRMVAHKYATKVFKNTQPYSRGEVAQVLIELDKKVKEGSLKLSRVEGQRLKQLLLFFSEDLQALHYPTTSHLKRTHLFKTQGRKHRFGVDFGMGESIISRKREDMSGKTGYATLFRPTVNGQIRDDFAFYSDLKVYYLGTTQFPDIPKTDVRIGQPPTKGATAALTTYYMKFKLPWFSLLFGKDNLHWGPGRHGALLISENPLPMNLIKLTARYHPVKFQAFTSVLGSELDKKYLSGHRLELHLWEKLHMGIAETIVYGERFENIYLNPVQIYATTEIPTKFVGGKATENLDNRLISGDLDFLLLKNLEFYGELLIDDFRPFAYGLSSYRNWGSKFGVLFGFYFVDPFSLTDTDFRLEYAFVNQYTYTHWEPITTYTHFDSIIGHHIGTDADNLWLNLKHRFTANLTMSLSYELERHGEGDVNKPHEGSGAPDDEEWEFLSGVTQSTSSLSLSLSYTSVEKAFAGVEYTYSWTKNLNNQLGVDGTAQQLIFSGSYRF